jgi:UDP-N-acetylglucosamine 1-carboxyvinyltransferase
VDHIVVRANGPLRGTVRVAGAKNSVLKLMAASLLAPGTHRLTNVPRILDVEIMGDLLRSLGAEVSAGLTDDEITITVNEQLYTEVPNEPMRRMRASIVVLGPLLARCGRAVMSMPGGDDFGVRPIDMHLKGLEALGAEFAFVDDVLVATAECGLFGCEHTLAFPSVGATENIVLAAVLAKGTSVLDNAAREPEVTDLLEFLNRMGAHIEGVGTPTLVIHGVTSDDLTPAAHRVVPDRVEAATYLAATGIAGGEVVVEGARADQMSMLTLKLTEMGMSIESSANGLVAAADGRLRSTDVATLPYPGIATDYKPMLSALLSVADGVGIVTENLFSGRFRYVEELVRMGADIHTDAHHAVVRGVPRLRGAEVCAHDIRAGAALVVAGLAADGETIVSGAGHIDRGYEDLVGKLRSLGADLERS